MSAAIAPKTKNMTDAEWQIRVDLAACYRLVARSGWDDLIYTHISAAVPGPTKHFLINPYGMMFGEITASSLVKVDLDGNIASDTTYKINPAGYTIHSAVHAAREDVKCVLHLHTTAGVAVSCQKQGLLPLNQTSLICCSDLAYHDYEGIALDLDERERLVGNLGSKNALMLRNHGTLTVGNTVAAAYVRMFFLERSCQMQIAALAGGAELNLMSKAMQERVHHQVTSGATGMGDRDWPALLRLLDREDPSYKN